MAKGDHRRIKINILWKKMRILRKLFYALAYSWLILFVVFQGLIWAKNYRHFLLRKRELEAAKTVNTPPPSATPYMSGFERNLDRSVIIFRLVFHVSCLGKILKLYNLSIWKNTKKATCDRAVRSLASFLTNIATSSTNLNRFIRSTNFAKLTRRTVS